MADSISTFLESYLINLFKIMKHGNYNEKVFTKKRSEILRINQICEDLFSEDYILQVIDNSTEIFCPHYPPKIFLPYQKISPEEDSRSSILSTNNIFIQSITKSINARCRNRFAVPAFTFQGKFLCRSSTLSGTFEIYGRQYFTSVFGGSELAAGNNPAKTTTGKEAFDQIRGDDKNLLENLKIRYIFDLMLEKKKMMFGLPMSSSEKVDRHNRYKDFHVISLPYPGCEFFNEWRSSGYLMKDMYFDWDNAEIDSSLQVPLSFRPTMTNFIKWEEYKKWDLTVLTTNYLKLIIGIIVEDDYSVLIHCISGWDRTPLFTSLIRCMLWADGFVHQSLNAQQILYLTLAYDWYLFGHQTKLRLEAGEEIIKFTFCFLNKIAVDHTTSVNYVYQILNRSANHSQGSQINHEDILQQKICQRIEKLEKLYYHFNRLYDQEMSAIVDKSNKKGSKSLLYSASSLVNGLFIGNNSNNKSSQS